MFGERAGSRTSTLPADVAGRPADAADDAFALFVGKGVPRDAGLQQLLGLGQPQQ